MSINEIPPPLRIREEDGNPNIIPVYDIIVSNGTVTRVGPGIIRLATGGGGGASIGGAVTGGSTPAVLFISNGLLAQDAPNFGYLDSQNELVLGTSASLGARIGVQLASVIETGMNIRSFALTSTGYYLTFQRSDGTNLFRIRQESNTESSVRSGLISTQLETVLNSVGPLGYSLYGISGSTIGAFFAEARGQTSGVFVCFNGSDGVPQEGLRLGAFHAGNNDGAGASESWEILSAFADTGFGVSKNVRTILQSVNASSYSSWTLRPNGSFANGVLLTNPPAHFYIENGVNSLTTVNLTLRADLSESNRLQQWQDGASVTQSFMDAQGDLDFSFGTNVNNMILTLAQSDVTIATINYRTGFFRGANNSIIRQVFVTQSTSSGFVFAVANSGDTQPRFAINPNASITFSLNGNTTDFILGANTQNNLSVDTTFVADSLVSGNVNQALGNGDIHAGTETGSRLFWDESQQELLIINSADQTMMEISADSATFINRQSTSYGTFVVGGSSQARLFIVNANSMNVGIATGTPDNSTRLFVNGIVGVAAGSSGLTAKLGGRLVVNTTTAGNVGIGADDLITYALSANTLASAGESIEIHAWGTFAANANSKEVILYLGSTQIFDTTAQLQNGGGWSLYSTITRLSATSAQCITEFAAPSLTLFTSAVSYVQATDNLAALNVIKCTGEAVADNDISQKGLIINHYPAT